MNWGTCTVEKKNLVTPLRDESAHSCDQRECMGAVIVMPEWAAGVGAGALTSIVCVGAHGVVSYRNNTRKACIRFVLPCFPLSHTNSPGN